MTNNSFDKLRASNRLTTNNGFTLLELLMVLAIAVVLMTIVMLSFSKLNAKQALDKSATLVVSVLNDARSLTLSSVAAASYGVHFEEAQIVLFKGNTYSAVSPDNVVTTLNALVALRDIALAGGGSDVVFKRLSGATDQPGTVEVFLKNEPDNFRTIAVSGTGVAEED